MRLGREGSQKRVCVIKQNCKEGTGSAPERPQKTVQVTHQRVVMSGKGVEYYPAIIGQCLGAAPEVT